MIKIPVPKSQTKVRNTFSPEQIVQLSSACQGGINANRDIAMLLLMLDCGLRVSELVSIDVEDVNLAEGYIKIKVGKGSKERMVPIGSFVQKMVWKYVNHSRPQPVTEKITQLFLSDDGLPLTRNGVQQMLRRCGKRAGIRAEIPEIASVAYCAAKAGINVMTQVAAIEYAKYNIRVNCIAPGMHHSELGHDIPKPNTPPDPQQMAAMQERMKRTNEDIPMNRMAEADELAGLAVLLASDASSYIIGQIIAQDGGWSAKH